MHCAGAPVGVAVGVAVGGGVGGTWTLYSPTRIGNTACAPIVIVFPTSPPMIGVITVKSHESDTCARSFS